MKIQKQITTVEQIEVEISLPYYSKSENCYFMIPNERGCIRVWVGEESASISYHQLSSSIKEAANYTEINESEFNEAFRKALSCIAIEINLLISASELPQPDEFEKDFTAPKEADSYFLDNN